MDMNWLDSGKILGQQITCSQAMSILSAGDEQLPAIFSATTAIRRAKFGDRAILCSILNAKSGACSEDCVFCSQSAHHNTAIEQYPMLDAERILTAHDEASAMPIERFGIVTSGRGLRDEELASLIDIIRARPDCGASFCASLGVLSEEQLTRLAGAGLKRYHHNLETAESFFPNICTTHTYDDRKQTVLAAKRAGLEVCCGGLFGLGETQAHRVELAMAICDLQVDAIPLNFLVAHEDTEIARREIPALTAADILKTIAMFRLVCQDVEIKVCAGREKHLGDMENQIFAAGATGMMIGGYLTVQGREVNDDLEMIRDAGMRP